MYRMYNLLLCCHYQHVICLLDQYLLRNYDEVYGIWLHLFDLQVPKVYASDVLLCNYLIHEHISNAPHDSISFKLTKFWVPCNITYFMNFFLLLSPYCSQSNWPRIALRFTRHDSVSTFYNLTLCRNSWIKIYCSYVSFEGNEKLFLSNTQLPILVK